MPVAEPIDDPPLPVLMPLGDRALLVRFAEALSDSGNNAAIEFARHIRALDLPGVTEVVPNLVSVLLRYDPARIDFAALAGEVRLALWGRAPAGEVGREWAVPVQFDGPDLPEVAGLLGLSVADFVAGHNQKPLRVLATGFAPGFVYCSRGWWCRAATRFGRKCRRAACCSPRGRPP